MGIQAKLSFLRGNCLLLLFTCLSASRCPATEEEAFAVPFDFVFDVMKPLGMPLVTSYHIVRESTFLNVRHNQGSVLETVGDFFLSPAQFLFAGKTIAFRNEDYELNYEIDQTFDYDHLFWMKASLSLIALPIAEPLGALFKGLAYLSSDVKERHQKTQRALTTSFTVSHLDEYRKKGLTAFHCDEFIPCQNLPRPSRVTKKQKIEREAFKEIISLLDEHKIIYWIDCGTCLGAYRHGGIIPWDIDIDIAIFHSDHDNVKRLLSTLDPEKYQIQDWSSYSKPKTFLKLFIKETQNLIDIYHYKFDDNKETISYYYSYEDSPFPDSWKKTERNCTKPLRFDQIFPLRRAHFDGLVVWAPHDVVEFLQSKYGENLDPSMLWDETACAFLKVKDHPYWNN